MPTRPEVVKRSQRFKKRYRELQSMRGSSFHYSTYYGPYVHTRNSALDASVDRRGDGYSPFEVITIKKGYGHLLTKE